MLIDPKSFKFTRKAPFIVLEGVNGAGKSTLQLALAEYLRHRGLLVETTREPGATSLGQKLRPILLSSKREGFSKLTELFLFAADRSEHVGRLITPMLDKGISVLSDRYYYSTVAFQGYGNGTDLQLIEKINRLAINKVLPDLVILLDLEPSEGLRRNRSQGEDGDSFEYESISYHQRIRNGFLEMAKDYPEPFWVLDASQPAETIFDQAKHLFEKALI
ncbi:MAG: dTMP kinase [Bdellovibrionales bacterium]|nr:dTMP kinase [Bdellovibrionales bacterium]